MKADTLGFPSHHPFHALPAFPALPAGLTATPSTRKTTKNAPNQPRSKIPKAFGWLSGNFRKIGSKYPKLSQTIVTDRIFDFGDLWPTRRVAMGV